MDIASIGGIALAIIGILAGMMIEEIGRAHV